MLAIGWNPMFIIVQRVLVAVILIAGLSSGWAGAQEPSATPSSSPTLGPQGQLSAPGGILRRGERAVEGTSLEDLLLEKGLITIDDWIRIRAKGMDRNRVVTGPTRTETEIY